MFFVIFLYITRYCQFKSRFVADNVGGCAFVDFLFAVAVDKATTMGHIKRDELSKAEVLIPNEADYKRIETLLQPIYDLIIANRIENKKLAETRDFLLPRLISGELDVSDIDL